MTKLVGCYNTKDSSCGNGYRYESRKPSPGRFHCADMISNAGFQKRRDFNIMHCTLQTLILVGRKFAGMNLISNSSQQAVRRSYTVDCVLQAVYSWRLVHAFGSGS